MDNSVQKYRNRRAARIDANWKEGDHPRGKDGKFVSGGDGGTGSAKIGKSVLSEKTRKAFQEDRNKFLKNFNNAGDFINSTQELKRDDVISDGKQAFVVRQVGGYRVAIEPLTKKDKTFDGEQIHETGEMKSIRHFSNYKVVGKFESMTERNMELSKENERGNNQEKQRKSEGNAQKEKIGKPKEVSKETELSYGMGAEKINPVEKKSFDEGKFIESVDELKTGDIISDGVYKYIVGTKGGYRTGLRTEKDGMQVMRSPKALDGKVKVIGHLDSSDCIEEYKKRRNKRLGVVENRMDSVEAYFNRKVRRLEARFDANPRVAYGIAKGMGIDTTDMEPKDVYEAIAKGGGNARGKRPHGNKEYELAKAGEKKPDKENYKTPKGTKFPEIDKDAKWDNSVLGEVDRLAKQGGRTKKYDRVMQGVSEKDVVYQKDVDGTKVASIPGLSQKFDNKMSGRSPECNEIYRSKIEKGKQIVDDMIGVTNGNGCRLMGLENCFKGGSSAAGKIDRKRRKDKELADARLAAGKINEEEYKKITSKTDEDYTRGFDDIVRFTVLSGHNDTVKSVNDTIKALESKGYECTELDNKWLPIKDENTGKVKPSEYKAVHLIFKSPTGEGFEVQVHSPESMKVKNTNHALYEEQRKPGTSSDRAKQLGETMAKNASTLTEPDGIMELKSFKKKNNG